MRKERWVIKIGSNLIVNGGPILIRSLMQQVAVLRKKKIEIVWVTSGAIASARTHLKLKTKFSKAQLSEKQAMSAIGQPLIMDLYNIALGTYSLQGAQILLTYDDLGNSKRRKNFQNTVETLLKLGCVPVLNENDAVSTDEIKFGDNDSLSAKVARYVNADRLILLTDVGGLYDSDPTKNKKAKLIPFLERVSAKTLNLAGGSGSKHGTGGMYSKVLAAKEACRYGITTTLVRGDAPNVLLNLERKSRVGTQIGGRYA